MKTRTDLLNHLASKYGLIKYLEIGVQVPELNFDKIICPYKKGIDPNPKAKASLCMTSDEFFKMIEDTLPSDGSLSVSYDLIFIDGLHTAEQVKKDFENSLKVLSPNGFIVLHDCNPLKEEHTIVPRPTPTGHWNGDVWKFAVALKGYSGFTRWTIDIDNGCMVIRNRGENWGNTLFGITEMSWSHFDKSRHDLLNLITWEQLVCRHDDPDNSGLCIRCSIPTDEGELL